MQVPRHVRGQALLCYDTRAAWHVPAVKRVLDEVPLFYTSTSALVLPIATYPHVSSHMLPSTDVCTVTYGDVW